MDNQKLIERVIYTASLATDPRQIDPIMDDVRAITARRGSEGSPLTEQDKATLGAVQQKLEEYLVGQERVRLFTKESVAIQIEQHLEGRSVRERFALLGLMVTALSAAAAIAGLLLLPGIPHENGQHIQLAGSVAFAIVHLGAAWLFLSALPAFKTELRRSFIFICLGIVVLSLGLVLQPMVEIFDWRRYALIAVIMSTPALIAAIFTYVGVRKYALLVGSVNRWSSLPVIGGAMLAVILITPVLPYLTAQNPSAVIHHAAASIQGLATVLAFFSFLMILFVGRRVADLYKPPARAYALALAVSLAVSLYLYGVRVIFGIMPAGIVSQVAALFLLVLGITLILAAYLFNKVSRY